MAERKAVNKYYPPDWTPAKGSINTYRNSHPLRERAKRLHEGILRIRFELPYNIWCGGCGNMVGMGVRYNADKSKTGMYYSTPIYKFRMKCHLCDNYFEIETDPKNCEYVILCGASRKNERWEQPDNEGHSVDREESHKIADNPMYKLEHGIQDQRRAKEEVPRLSQIEKMQDAKYDDFKLNQQLRRKFRGEKKEIKVVKDRDNALLAKASLEIALVDEDPEDVKQASKIFFHSKVKEMRSKQRAIKAQSIFGDRKNGKGSSVMSKGLIEPHRFKLDGTKRGKMDIGVKRREERSLVSADYGESDSDDHS
eukprot:m.8236 g.8236  ORF g.8236 m.8236 type:complete len:310 (+) comp20435_c0_seq1:38-967(+)